MIRIFYFSGTGNSYSVARTLAKQLNGVMVNLADYLANPEVVDDEVVGIVTPTYCMDLPEVVQKFLRRVNMKDVKYVFCVATMGATAGRTLHHAKDILEERGYKLHSGFSLTLPDNSIVFPSGEEKTKKFLAEENSKINGIVDNIKIRYNNSSSLKDNFIWAVSSPIGMWVLENVFNIKEKTVKEDKCNGCGICSIVCPMHCIKIVDDKPQFGPNCATCFACAQWCPREAINLGKLHPTGKTKYVHPGIPVKEFAGQTTLAGMDD